MKAFIALFILFPMGWVLMKRKSMDNKKYPDTYDAHFERQEKLYSQFKKMEKRYGKDSDQAKAAWNDHEAEQKEWIEISEKNKEK